MADTLANAFAAASIHGSSPVPALKQVRRRMLREEGQCARVLAAARALSTAASIVLL